MNSNTDPGTVLVAIIFAAVLFVLIGGLLLTIGWNLGAVAILAALGKTAGTISIFEGMGVLIGLLPIAGLFKTQVKTS